MTEKQSCNYCKKEIDHSEKLCKQCSYPLNGSAIEKKSFYDQINEWKNDFENVAIDVRRYFAIQEGILVALGLFFIASVIAAYLFGKFLLGYSALFFVVGFIFWRLARWRVKESISIEQALRYGATLWIVVAVLIAMGQASIFWTAFRQNDLKPLLLDLLPISLPLAFSVFMAYYGLTNARRLKNVEEKQRILELNDVVWSKIERNLEKREDNYERIDSFLDK